MKKNIVLFSLIFTICNCKNKNSDNQNQKKITSETLEENKTPIFSNKDFKLLYQYSDGGSNQIIGINFIDPKNIKFHIVTKTLPCDTEYWGVAKNKYGDLASEVDEDENGTAYGSSEYIMNQKECDIYIRMALDSTKLQIKYSQKDSLDTDCLPITDRIMKRIK